MGKKKKICPICGKPYHSTITNEDGTITGYVHRINTENIWGLRYIQPEDICTPAAGVAC